MSREEDLIRSTTRAIASAVREVPPLRLEAAADDLRFREPAPRQAHGTDRRWRGWLAPVTAAAVVVALAVSLVLVKNLPNGSPVPRDAPASAFPAVSAGLATATGQVASAGPDGIPRYYVALDTTHNKVLVGDSVAGKTTATFAAPAGMDVESVTGAADDRTFVLYAQTSLPWKTGEEITGSWYEIRLAPGAPARLSRLPIPPLSWVASLHGINGVFGTTLSASGQELAVGEVNTTGGRRWEQVKVFSLATGRLLHDWATANPSVILPGSLPLNFGSRALTWLNRDQALAVATLRLPGEGKNKPAGAAEILRRLPVAGPASGDLLADSTAILTVLPQMQTGPSCTGVGQWPLLISADGSTAACTSVTLASGGHWSWDFLTYPLAGGISAANKGMADYKVPKSMGGDLSSTSGESETLLWVSPSAGTLIGLWSGTNQAGKHAGPTVYTYAAVISHGKFTPLRLPNIPLAWTGTDIAF